MAEAYIVASCRTPFGKYGGALKDVRPDDLAAIVLRDVAKRANLDPNDIDDAALAAGVYLCRGGRDLSKADAWWDAILSYNAVRPYAQKVYDAANEYGVRSRV